MIWFTDKKGLSLVPVLLKGFFVVTVAILWILLIVSVKNIQYDDKETLSDLFMGTVVTDCMQDFSSLEVAALSSCVDGKGVVAAEFVFKSSRNGDVVETSFVDETLFERHKNLCGVESNVLCKSYDEFPAILVRGNEKIPVSVAATTVVHKGAAS